MSNEIVILLFTAASIGFVHTILGPDHYIPFIVMAKAGKWSTFKTVWVTVLSGIGHVLSSVVIGAIGISFGIAIGHLEIIESIRGEIAGWLLMSFGIIYFIWGVRRMYKNIPHKHWHSHSQGEVHNHQHNHKGEHAHVHEKENIVNLTPWILFTIFVFGPCEALIPVLMYPAAASNNTVLIAVVLVFGLATIATMLSVVLISVYGFRMIHFGKFEKFSHVLAGLLILLSGTAINFLGL